MNILQKTINKFEKYFIIANSKKKMPKNFVTLEIGPGDSIISGLVSKAYGAKTSWLIDEGAYSKSSLSSFKNTSDLLKSKKLPIPEINDYKNLSELLDQFDIRYLTKGIKSFSQIQDGSIDFCWSQVVLEHVSFNDFSFLLKELRRILKRNSISVHSIDFKDHLGGGLNNLRFPDLIWESKMFKNSGFYTNRIRPDEMLRMFKNEGFLVKILNTTRWSSIPIQRKKLADRFQHCSEDSLLISELLIQVSIKD